MTTYYKPLTPTLREQINQSLDKNVAELMTCEKNVLVNAQIASSQAQKNLINALPDGYLLPFTKE